MTDSDQLDLVERNLSEIERKVCLNLDMPLRDFARQALNESRRKAGLGPLPESVR